MSVQLPKMQRQHSYPATYLFGNATMYWSLTLLQQLHMQQCTVNEYLCKYRLVRELVFFSPHQWIIIQNVCTNLPRFFEVIRKVSYDEAGISNMTPLVFLLEYALHGVIDQIVMDIDDLSNT